MMNWPRLKILRRAIDNDPDVVLQWLSDNLTQAQCLAFADVVSPVTDELRAARLAQAVDLAEAYAGEAAAAVVKDSLTTEISKLEPAEPVESIKK